MPRAERLHAPFPLGACPHPKTGQGGQGRDGRGGVIRKPDNSRVSPYRVRGVGRLRHRLARAPQNGLAASFDSCTTRVDEDDAISSRHQ